MVCNLPGAATSLQYYPADGFWVRAEDCGKSNSNAMRHDEVAHEKRDRRNQRHGRRHR